MNETKKRHRNQHSWNWMNEFGGYYSWCSICHRCWDGISNPKKYLTHKQAFIEVLKVHDATNHPDDCDCIVCGNKDGRELQRYYKKYYKLD
jgi:hypothetical protein